jgi:hypothetical protein
MMMVVVVVGDGGIAEASPSAPSTVMLVLVLLGDGE